MQVLGVCMVTAWDTLPIELRITVHTQLLATTLLCTSGLIGNDPSAGNMTIGSNVLTVAVVTANTVCMLCTGLCTGRMLGIMYQFVGDLVGHASTHLTQRITQCRFTTVISAEIQFPRFMACGRKNLADSFLAIQAGTTFRTIFKTTR